MEVPGGQGALRINTAPNILSYHYSGSTILECFFVNIFTEVPVSRHGCSVLHVLTWRRGSLCLFAISSTNLHFPPFLNKGAATTQQMWKEVIAAASRNVQLLTKLSPYTASITAAGQYQGVCHNIIAGLSRRHWSVLGHWSNSREGSTGEKQGLETQSWLWTAAK